MNNEKGIALVTVLLTIVVTILLLGTLASIILSTGAQTQRSQENIQADSLAMMGQEYITSSFESVKNDASSQVNEKVSTTIQQWAGEHSITERRLGEGEYVVTLENVEGQSLTYKYNAKGIVENQEEIITGTLSITQELSEQSWQERIIEEKQEIENSFTEDNKTVACDGSKKNDYFTAGDYWLTIESCVKGPNEDIEFDEGSRLWIQGDLEMKGDNSITIKGFTYFDMNNLYMNGGNSIEVNGDVFVSTNDFRVDKMTTNASIFINGNAYFEDPEASAIRELNICVTGNTNADNIPACQEG